MKWLVSNYRAFFILGFILSISACGNEDDENPQVAETTKTISFELYADIGSTTINNFAVSNDGAYIFYTSNNQVNRYHVASGEVLVLVNPLDPPPGTNSCYVHYLDGKLYVINIESNKSYVHVSSNNGDTFTKHHIGTKLGSLDFEGPFWRVFLIDYLKCPMAL